jgi:hypothetical protein
MTLLEMSPILIDISIFIISKVVINKIIISIIVSFVRQAGTTEAP